MLGESHAVYESHPSRRQLAVALAENLDIVAGKRAAVLTGRKARETTPRHIDLNQAMDMREQLLRNRPGYCSRLGKLRI